MINNDAYATGFMNTSVIENSVEILLNILVFICVPYFLGSKKFSDFCKISYSPLRNGLLLA